mmetsp:Transcript_34706/g.88320  ORF Transcript_34706/g.88320 Transcript_34706/m.88320 type:complete len:368 (+) Transcript_34706:560-1663(+)
MYGEEVLAVDLLAVHDRLHLIVLLKPPKYAAGFADHVANLGDGNEHLASEGRETCLGRMPQDGVRQHLLDGERSIRGGSLEDDQAITHPMRCLLRLLHLDPHPKLLSNALQVGALLADDRPDGLLGHQDLTLKLGLLGLRLYSSPLRRRVHQEECAPRIGCRRREHAADDLGRVRLASDRPIIAWLRALHPRYLQLGLVDQPLGLQYGLQRSLDLARPAMLHVGLMLQNDLRAGPLSERLDAGALLADNGTADFAPEHHRDGKPCRLGVALSHVSLAQLVVQEHLGIGHLVKGAHDDDPPGLQFLCAAGHAHLAAGLCCRVLDLAAASAQHCSGHAVGDHQMQAHLVCAGWAPAEIARAKQPLRWAA